MSANPQEPFALEIVPGMKVWPVKSVDLRAPSRFWCGQKKVVSRPARFIRILGVPTTSKFSQFITANSGGRKFVMAMFDYPIPSEDDAAGTFIVGVVFDSAKAVKLHI